jgi:chemosensory pili system protein ChpC
MVESAAQIRSVMIPIRGGRLLLPNATVAEVVLYRKPDPVEGAPPWILGTIVWRGWRVPVISPVVLAERENEEDPSRANLAILKGLGGKVSHLAVPARGVPRLTTVGPGDAEVGDAPIGNGVLRPVMIDGEAADIPDLDQIQRMLVATGLF